MSRKSSILSTKNKVWQIDQLVFSHYFINNFIVFHDSDLLHHNILVLTIVIAALVVLLKECFRVYHDHFHFDKCYPCILVTSIKYYFNEKEVKWSFICLYCENGSTYYNCTVTSWANSIFYNCQYGTSSVLYGTPERTSVILDLSCQELEYRTVRYNCTLSYR